METGYKFEIPNHHKSIIKVIGVGGGGSNAVNHMYNEGIRDVEFVICNTDSQALKTSPIPNKLQIGVNLTEGLGAGANPEKGREAAEESKEEIRDLLADNTKMVFITAGMGGGTGTGAAPVIAKISNDLGILTVGIVTAPFLFEGKKKMQAAEAGIQELRKHCDTVLVIMNDKLRQIYGNLGITEAFSKADNVLTTAAKGIAEIITVPGYINVDFQDVQTVMKKAGAAVMGSGISNGENRALRAAEEAISSPLLNNQDILGAQKILLSIISGEEAELQMDELTEITEYIQQMAGDEAEVIFGHGIDPEMGTNISVTVIATGFGKSNEGGKINSEPDKKVIDLESNKQIKLFDEEEEEEDNDHSELEKPNFYVFESPIRNKEVDVTDEEEENKEEEYFDLNEEFEVFEKDEEPEQMRFYKHNYNLESKKESLIQKSKERIQRLKQLGNKILDPDSLKHKLEIPAYERKKVKLKDAPHSSESNISRYHLNDDNEIVKNNRFLHDNVD